MGVFLLYGIKKERSAWVRTRAKENMLTSNRARRESFTSETHLIGGEGSMKYDFTTIMDRRGKDAIAVDMIGNGPGFAPDAPKDGFDVIPMWIADMNFPVVPTI